MQPNMAERIGYCNDNQSQRSTGSKIAAAPSQQSRLTIYAATRVDLREATAAFESANAALAMAAAGRRRQVEEGSKDVLEEPSAGGLRAGCVQAVPTLRTDCERSGNVQAAQARSQQCGTVEIPLRAKN